MKGDRERCLAAGMDDYLAKPVRRDELNALLARWIVPNAEEAADELDATLRVAATARPSTARPGSGDAASGKGANGEEANGEGANGEGAHGDGTSDGEASDVSEPVDPSPETGAEGLPPRVDDAALDTIRALQRPGKPDLLTKVLRTFFDRTPAILETMHRALETEDAVALGEQVHSLKSSSAYVGAARLSTLCTRLEQASSDGDAGAVAALVARIDDEFSDVSAELSERVRAA